MDDLRRILVVKLADLGDLLTATPALRALRMRYPASEITALVTPHTAGLLMGNDSVNRVITFPKALFDHPVSLSHPGTAWPAIRLGATLTWRLRASRFDAVALLHHVITPWGRVKYEGLLAATGAPVRIGLGNGSFLTHRAVDAGFGGRHEVDYWLDVVAQLGAAHPCPCLELHLDVHELDAVERRWNALGLAGRKVVAIHPGSGAFSVARRWPPERYAEVADALAADGLAIAVIAGPGEEPLVKRTQAAMRASAIPIHGSEDPRTLAGLLGRCRLFIGNDSGVMHLAASVGVPCVGVFGLSNHRAWGPYPPGRHRVVRLDLPCSPCLYHDFQLGTPQGCAARTCLMDLTPQPVLAAARDLLAQEGTEGRPRS
jgi:heptosyltransferase-2